MAITVEFFGIPRVRAGLERVDVPVMKKTAMLSEVLASLAQRLPGFAESCMQGDRLSEHCIASIDGAQFLGAEDIEIEDHRTIILLSADAGG
jgi:molybdopterin converting factor small subunit